MKISIEYLDGRIVEIPQAGLRSSDWSKDVHDCGVLGLLLFNEQRLKFVNLNGMIDITFEYEHGDSEYEAGLCGVNLGPVETKDARPSTLNRISHHIPSSTLYSDWLGNK